ncbi:MAG: response regulator transcription factor [Saprospiraceae bacterium]|jgi:DNA-binding NarL/FixJ family response regulator|nr:response regulator transcription factor [Saprospiraceae bacterium]
MHMTAPAVKSLNVLIADGHPIFVEGLRNVLSVPNGRFLFQLKGVVQSPSAIADMLSRSPIDVLLMDMNLSDNDGLSQLPYLKKANPNLRILLFTYSDDARLVKAAFRAGCDGLLLKSTSRDELIRAVEEVVAGKTYLGKGVSLTESIPGMGADTALPESRFARKYGLTRREIEVMRYIGQVLNNKDIAAKLFISDQTVSVHRKNIMRKLRVNNTASLIKIAFENNLV